MWAYLFGRGEPLTMPEKEVPQAAENVAFATCWVPRGLPRHSQSLTVANSYGDLQYLRTKV